MTAPWNKFFGNPTTQMRRLTPVEQRQGEGRPAALETPGHGLNAVPSETITVTEPANFEDRSGLQPYDTVYMFHARTKKYYQVTVMYQVTEEEAIGG